MLQSENRRSALRRLYELLLEKEVTREDLTFDHAELTGWLGMELGGAKQVLESLRVHGLVESPAHWTAKVHLSEFGLMEAERVVENDLRELANQALNWLTQLVLERRGKGDHREYGDYFVSPGDAAKALSMERPWMQMERAFALLEHEGYLKRKDQITHGSGPTVYSLTRKAWAGLVPGTADVSSPKQLIVNLGSVGTIQGDSSNATVTQVIAQDMQEILRAVEALRSIARSETLAEDVLDDLDVLQEQVQAKVPNLVRLGRALKRLAKTGVASVDWAQRIAFVAERIGLNV